MDHKEYQCWCPAKLFGYQMNLVLYIFLTEAYILNKAMDDKSQQMSESWWSENELQQNIGKANGIICPEGLTFHKLTDA